MKSVEDILKGQEICVCAGSGGVGKTTTSAAIAVGMAAKGLKTCVLTIDPAKRLADSLGLEELGNEAKQVDPTLFESEGIEMKGELWAMMLDAKATFDDLIKRHASDEEARERVLDNKIYQQISGALAGSQEYMAMEKLYELHTEGRFDLLVLDTPPSRNALDFLDAPTRLVQFIEGKSLRIFIKPTGFAAKIAGRGASAAVSVLKRVLGFDLLADLSEFFTAFSGMIDGFRERAAKVNALLASPTTTFLVITGPQDESIDEALHFHEKLVEADMPFGGAIVNKVRMSAGGDAPSPEKLTKTLTPLLNAKLAENVADVFCAEQVLAERDRLNIKRLEKGLSSKTLIQVPYFDQDVHDLEGLARVNRHLFGDDSKKT